MSLKTTLLPPERPNHIPEDSQWLAGEGAGSWFSIKSQGTNFQINRFSPEGNLECSGTFTVDSKEFNIEQEYQFVHLSHCKTVRIQQNHQTFLFNRD